MEMYSFDAVIFDLDGVVTKTALVHSAAWKKMFDDYLKERELKFFSKLIPQPVTLILKHYLTEEERDQFNSDFFHVFNFPLNSSKVFILPSEFSIKIPLVFKKSKDLFTSFDNPGRRISDE